MEGSCHRPVVENSEGVLEKNYEEDMNDEQTIKLTIKSLLEVVQTGAKNIEVAVLKANDQIHLMTVDEIKKYVDEIEEEKAAEAEKKKPLRD